MREIKFRVWNTETNKMIINVKEMGVFALKSIHTIDEFLVIPTNEKYPLMQYTGLKDKNGVEIYEGDIVSFTLFDCFDNDVQYIGKILFNNGAFYIEYMNKYELYSSILCYVISQDDEFEVIGNIYENS